MEKEILELLKEMKSEMSEMNNKIDNIENEVKEMKSELKGVSIDLKDVSKKLDGVVDQTADLTEFRTEVIDKLDELKSVEEITKLNCYDIAKLRVNNTSNKRA